MGPVSMQRLINWVHTLSQEQLIHELTHFQGRVRLDYTRSFLSTLSRDRLRHLLLAAHIQNLRPASVA
jgi:hypothetical protein